MSTSWENYEIPGAVGGGWGYDNANMAYDDAEDPDTGEVLRYDGEGTAQVWTTINKS